MKRTTTTLLLVALGVGLSAQMPVDFSNDNHLNVNTLTGLNAGLQLDSMLSFGYSAGGDSTLVRRRRYTYPSAEVQVDSTYQNTFDGTGYVVQIHVNRRVYDDLNRVTTSERTQWGNGVWQYTQSTSNYWHGSSNFTDSVYTFLADNNTPTLFNDSRDYNVFLPDTTLVKDYFYQAFNAMGEQLYRLHRVWSFNPDLRVASFTALYQQPDGSEQPNSRILFTYSGDTVWGHSDAYVAAQALWRKSGVSVQVLTANQQQVLHNYNYDYSGPDSTLRLLGETHFTYDSGGKLLAYDAGTYLAGSTLYRFVYNYLPTGELQMFTWLAWQASTSEWKLRQRDFYFYSPLSSTQQPSLPTILVKVAPNPATDAVWLDAGTQAIQAVRVFDLNGRLVRTLTGVNQPTAALERGGLPAGVYRVQVQLANGAAAVTVVFR